MKRAVPKISGGAALWASASPTQGMVARALTCASCYEPRGPAAGFRGPTTCRYNQAPGFVLRGEPRARPSLWDKSPPACGAVGLKAGSSGWAGLGLDSLRLPRSGRPPSGQDQGVPRPGWVPERPLFLQELYRSPVPCFRKPCRKYPQNPETPGLCLRLEVQSLEESIWPEPCGGCKAFCRVSSRVVGMC